MEKERLILSKETLMILRYTLELRSKEARYEKCDLLEGRVSAADVAYWECEETITRRAMTEITNYLVECYGLAEKCLCY